MFQAYKFISETLDYFFRYAYFVCFLIYLCNRLSVLYDLMWLYSLSIAIFIASFFVYVYLLLKVRMYDNEWSLKFVYNHYTRFRCIFPKRKFKLVKREDIYTKKEERKNKRA